MYSAHRAVFCGRMVYECGIRAVIGWVRNRQDSVYAVFA